VQSTASVYGTDDAILAADLSRKGGMR